MTMNNINFVNIDNNRIASAKQVYGVACHFARIDSSSPSERFGKQKVYHAILNKFYGDHDTKMTHGEVTDFFEHQEVPKVFLDLVKKPKAKAKEKAIKVVNSVAKKLDNRVDILETKVSDMDSKLDAMLKILQAK